MRRLVSIVAALMLLGALAGPARAQTQSGTISWVPPCAIACSYWIDNGFAPCANDFPPGTYGTVDLPIATAVPGRAVIGDATIRPHIDWDGFICGPNGELVATGANLLGRPCDGLGVDSPLPIGCPETMTWVMAPGVQYTLLAYNWSDDQDLPWTFGGGAI
jgi:hypothetical protein